MPTKTKFVKGLPDYPVLQVMEQKLQHDYFKMQAGLNKVLLTLLIKNIKTDLK